MKKYLQITVVFALFFLAVFLRNLKGNGDSPRVIGANLKQNPSPSPAASASNTPGPTPTPTGSSSAASSSSTTSSPSPSPVSSGQYKDGTYTGSVADAYYGNIQVQAIISGGNITAVNFLQYPNDNGTSRFINSQAIPLLQQEALQSQNANVDVVSGASDSSAAFQQSLGDALQQAKS